MFADLIKWKVKRSRYLNFYITQCIFPRHAPTILMEVRCTLNINFTIRVHCVRTNFKYFMWLSSATQFVFSSSLSWVYMLFPNPPTVNRFFMRFLFFSSSSSSWTHKLASSLGLHFHKHVFRVWTSYIRGR